MVHREQGRRADLVEDRTLTPEQEQVLKPAGTSKPQGTDDDHEFERAMELGRQVMKDHHAVLAALAK